MIEDRIKKIQNLMDKEAYEDSLSLCDEFIKDYPESWAGYRTKADILMAVRNYQGSLEAREELAKMGSDEPADYYDLTRLCLTLGKNEDCVRWANKGIQLCEQHQDFYYHQACHFYKANALINLKRPDEALRTCEVLDDNYGAYIAGIGMKTKEELISTAKNAKSDG